jgi:hypothetical protein
MSKPQTPPPALQTIDPAALAQVSGGTVTGTTDDQVMTALTGILSSIQQLGQQNHSALGMNPTEMMMFMMVMEQRNAQSVAAVAGGYPWGQPIVYY